TIGAGNTLMLSSAAPVTATSSNAATTSVISLGTLGLASGANTFNIGAIQLFDGVNNITYTTNQATLNITSVISGASSSITKTGNGLLQLSAQSTFAGGMTVQSGGIILGASSTSTSFSGLVSGPMGSGAVAFADGTSLWVDNASRTVANALTFAGNPVFNNVSTTLTTLTLNGPLTFNTLTTSGLVVDIATPFLNVALNGVLTNAGLVTSIGTGSGAGSITKTGLGNINNLNLTGVSGAALNISGLTNSATYSLLHDGDGTGSSQTLNFGAITWEPPVASNTVLNLTLNRAATGTLYNLTSANKIFTPTSFTASLLANGLTLTNSSGYGIVLPTDITLASGNNFNVVTGNISTAVDGLVLNGQISGTTILTKTGNGTLRLGNSANDFTGTVDILRGVVSVSADGQLGNAANVINLNPNSTVASTLRATSTFALDHVVNLANTTNTRAIEVTLASPGVANVLTLNSAFTHTGGAAAGLQKLGEGTLVLTQDQANWDGVLTVTQGTVRATHAGAFGTTVGGIQVANVGAGIEISHATGMTIGDALVFNSSNNTTSRGMFGNGGLRNLQGDNTWNGQISIGAEASANDNVRSATITADAGSSLTLTGGLVGKIGATTSNRGAWFAFGGAGTINLTTTGLTHTNSLANGDFSLVKFGTGTMNIQVANAHSGEFVYVNGGVLSLNGAGTLGVPGASGGTGNVYVEYGGTLTLDNTVTALDNRLSGRNWTMRYGNLNILGADSATTTETVGTLTNLRYGSSTVTLVAGSGGQLNFTSGTTTRDAGGVLLIRATDFGAEPGADVATFTATNWAFTGQLGGTGASNKSILPWAIGDTNTTSGVGIGFVTADSAAAGANTGGNRLRLLSGSEQVSALSTTNANVNLTSSVSLPNSQTINSLQLGASSGISMSNNALLSIASGGLLVTANSSITGTGRLSTVSNVELIIHALADLNLGVVVTGTSGGLTKSGAGVLTLGAGNTYTGATHVNQGTLKLTGDFSLSPGQEMRVVQGAFLDLNGTRQNFSSLRSDGDLAQNDRLPENSGGTVINTSATKAVLAMTAPAVSWAGRIGNDTLADSDIAVFHATAAGAVNDWYTYGDNTFTGEFVQTGGRTIMMENSRFSGTSLIELSQSTLLIYADNLGAAPLNPVIFTDRINDNAAVLLRGGMFQWRGQAGMTYSETVGALTLAEGNSFLDIAEPGTNRNSIDLTFASLARQANSRATLRSVGVDGIIGDAARVYFTAAPTLTNNILGGWAVVNQEFASYTTGMGLGQLNQTGYAGYSPVVDVNLGTSVDNIRIALPAAGTTITLTGNRTINTLNLAGAGSSTANSTLNLGGNTLTLGGGGLIVAGATDNRAITIQGGNLTAGAVGVGGDLYLHALGWSNNNDTGNRDVILNASVVDNGAPVTLVIVGDAGRGGVNVGTNEVFINAANSHTGGTFVNSGYVRLNVAGADGVNTAAVPGNLTIAGGYTNVNTTTLAALTTTVQFLASNQIQNTASVTILGGSVLDLNGFSQTLAGITFNNTGGNTPTLSIGTGMLTLNGNVTATSQNLGAVSLISSTGAGTLNLNGAVRTFDVGAVKANLVELNSVALNPIVPSLNITAVTTGTGAGILKTGNGLLQLSAQNTFTGGVTVNAGGLVLGVDSTPSVAGTTTVTSGAVGTGALSMAAGTTLLVNNAS
ncbi:MAG: autotransporter-associated beta strand repeat-containing protein, partial [Gammaproteobacteria bacterium]|nr:autotransporter-associated beta strand repeat-containing protein [Gammaproteobacteria bacterium]